MQEENVPSQETPKTASLEPSKEPLKEFAPIVTNNKNVSTPFFNLIPKNYVEIIPYKNLTKNVYLNYTYVEPRQIELDYVNSIFDFVHRRDPKVIPPPKYSKGPSEVKKTLMRELIELDLAMAREVSYDHKINAYHALFDFYITYKKELTFQTLKYASSLITIYLSERINTYANNDDDLFIEEIKDRVQRTSYYEPSIMINQSNDSEKKEHEKTIISFLVQVKKDAEETLAGVEPDSKIQKLLEYVIGTIELNLKTPLNSSTELFGRRSKLFTSYMEGIYNSQLSESIQKYMKSL